jgi:hypothetical protein
LKFDALMMLRMTHLAQHHKEKLRLFPGHCSPDERSAGAAGTRNQCTDNRNQFPSHLRWAPSSWDVNLAPEDEIIDAEVGMIFQAQSKNETV